MLQPVQFNKENETQQFLVFTHVKESITNHPDADYYEINDIVHDRVKKTFKYTHDLRKAYQEQIKFVFRKQGKKFPL